MLVDEISTKVKRWAIILTVEPVDFLAHMGYKNWLRIHERLSTKVFSAHIIETL